MHWSGFGIELVLGFQITEASVTILLQVKVVICYNSCLQTLCIKSSLYSGIYLCSVIQLSILFLGSRRKNHYTMKWSGLEKLRNLSCLKNNTIGLLKQNYANMQLNIPLFSVFNKGIRIYAYVTHYNKRYIL